MAAFLDVCRYIPTAGGTSDWTFAAAVTGYQSPTAAGVSNGTLYKYRAESGDLTQWEMGEGAYNTATGVLARTTVLFNNLGTTAKVSFNSVPQVAIVALAEDMVPQTRGQLPGAISNTNASAGNVGEYIESVVGSGAPVTLTTGTQTNITSISLTAGDWDTSAIFYALPAATTSITRYVASISGTSATIASSPGQFSDFTQAGTVSGGTTFNNAIPSYRWSLAGTTTIFLVALVNFSVSTCSGYGLLRARRVR